MISSQLLPSCCKTFASWNRGAVRTSSHFQVAVGAVRRCPRLTLRDLSAEREDRKTVAADVKMLATG